MIVYREVTLQHPHKQLQKGVVTYITGKNNKDRYFFIFGKQIAQVKLPKIKKCVNNNLIKISPRIESSCQNLQK